jgi:iron complex outermembrane recepter protein
MLGSQLDGERLRYLTDLLEHQAIQKEKKGRDVRFAARLRTRVLCCLLAGSPAVAASASGSSFELSTDIPAQPLQQALDVFANSTHLQLVYVSQLVLGKMSRSVAAGVAETDGLSRLLEGTGLTYQFLNSRTVKILEQPKAVHPAADDQEVSLNEVVVTAMKRDELLSTVPMSVSVLSAERLSVSGITDIRGIAAVSSGVEYDFSSQFGPGILTDIAIRGISAQKGDATTGIYIDDTPVQMPHSVFNNPYPLTFDLARVEVLRGPQGVLFGRSAEGGAIRFVTNEPSTTTTSELYRSEISATDHGGMNYEVGAAAGGPLVTDLLGARISAWYRHDGGYVDRIDPFTGATVDADANHSASQVVRLGFAFEPDDRIRIVPGFTYQSVSLHDTPVFYADQSDPAAGVLDNGKLLDQPSSDRFTMSSVRMTARLGGANLTVITAYFDRTAAATVDQTNAAGIAYFDGFGNPLGPAFPTAYSDAIPSLLTLHQLQESAEMRIASAGPATPLTWLGGIFYSRLGESSTQNTFAITAPSNPGILTDGDDVTRELSIFGYGRWSFTSHWSAGAGMRLGWTQTSGWSRNGGFANAGATPFAQSSARETLPPTPRFDLSYQPDSLNLFYAAVARGFRSGGINGIRPIECGGSTDPLTYAPDSVWSFELGAKNQLFGSRLQLNTSIFDIRWPGIQEHIYDACGNGFTTNAGEARSTGFDLDLEALITERLRMTLALGMLDARYIRTVRAAGGQLIVDNGSVVGGVPSVPAPWSGTLSARYDWPLVHGAMGYVRIEDIVHSHNPGPFSELDPRNINYDPSLRADPATNLLNLQLGMTWWSWDIKVFVDNALDSQPDLQRDVDAPGSALVYAYTLRPRTVGVRVNWSF